MNATIKNIKICRGVCTLRIISGLCVALFFVVFVAYPVNADEYVHVEQWDANTAGSDHPGQYFTPTKNNVSSLTLRANTASSSSDWLLYFCHGDYDASVTWQENGKCEGNGQTELMAIAYYDRNIIAGLNNFDFPDFQITNFDGKNYFWLQPIHGVAGIVGWRSDNTNPYDGGWAIVGPNPTGIDWKFRLFYESSFIPDVTIIELPEWSGTVQIGAEVGLVYNENGSCFINEPCALRVNYGFDSIGDIIYLNDYYGDQTETINCLASSTLPNAYFLRVDLDVPMQTVPGKKKYCIYHEKINDNFLYCDLTVNWVEDNTVDYFALYDCENVCEGMATTSLFYSIECGLKKIVCWAFMPQKDTLGVVVDSITEIENSFPFNTVFSFLNIANEAFSTTTQPDSTLGIPFVDKEGELYILPVISSTSMPNAIGEENTALFRRTIGYIVWICVIIIVVVQIF